MINKLFFLLLVLVPLLLVLVVAAPSLVFGFGMGNMTQTTNMTTYKDPLGRFSVLVPTVWNTTGQTDRFSNTLLNTLDGLGTGMV